MRDVSMSSIDGKLLQVLVETLQVPPAQIQDQLSMQHVESWDSLRHMQLIAAIESKFDVQLGFDEIVSMRTVGAIRQVLSKHGVGT